jgi:hypothetical protein
MTLANGLTLRCKLCNGDAFNIIARNEVAPGLKLGEHLKGMIVSCDSLHEFICTACGEPIPVPPAQEKCGGGYHVTGRFVCQLTIVFPAPSTLGPPKEGDHLEGTSGMSWLFTNGQWVRQ